MPAMRKASKWTFWYCNDVGVTLPPISPWHCWYVANETHDDVNWTNQTFNVVMTSSRLRKQSSWKKSSRIVYHFRICYNNPTFILWQMKIKASGEIFLSCCYQKFAKYFQTTLLYLKVICNIVSENTYWERRTKMWLN